ncbi:MAG TPA: TMAO reductase system sensor histidine kinase/response regulator TorS [Oceanospirillaceae bacterium]|nr:TMAO reductase system sensor histidine kinase/response regulator TorS [Oceanospirillaceae bacterium]
MAVKLGVGGKLLFIMTSTVGLVLIVAVIGVLGFEQVANKQNSVIDNTIPAIVTSHSLNLANSRLVNTVPSISKATSLAEVGKLSQTVEQQLRIFLDVADQFETANYPLRGTVALVDIVKQIEANLQHQLSWRAIKLDADRSYFLHVSTAVKAVSEVESISTSLVANANTTTTAITSGLYDLVESNKDQLYTALDRLIDVDLDHMERMYELRKRSTSLLTLLSRLSTSVTPEEVNIIQQQTLTDLNVLKRRVAEINDPGRRKQANKHLQVFNAILVGNDGISLFALRSKSLLAESQQQGLAEGVKSQIEEFNNQVIVISKSVGEGLKNTTNDARNAVAAGRNLVLYVSIAIVLLGMAFLWFYLRRSLFSPLDRVNNALLSVAKGDLSAQVSYSRDDEIGRLSRTVQVFKDNASVRLELEQQQEIVERRLRNHQNELEQQIQQRTLQLQSVNERLEKTVKDHQLAREEAEQANQAKTAFLATMSHEIRTPLGGILGTLRLLGQTAVDTKQRHYVEHSLEAAEALLSILNGILDFAKVEANEVLVESSPCRMQQIASTLKVLMQPVADDKGVDLFLQIAPELEADYYMLDKGKVHQVLFNLLSNAIKFTPSGAINLSIERVEQVGEVCLRFQVMDTGLGIPPEIRDRLFQPFTQYDASTSRRFGGTGLGLSICRKLVDAMHGRMGIESRIANDYTEGTCCWFELPFEVVNVDGNHNEEPTKGVGSNDQKHILLVEDNKIGRVVAEGYLLQMGHTVECAVDGFHALEFAQQDFDVILMDISMPGMDGVETAMKMRTIHQQGNRYIPIIAMSAHIFPQEIEEFLRAGLDGFIGKPVDFQRFMLLLQDVKKASQKLVSLPQEHDAELLNEAILEQDLSALGQDTMQQMISLYRSSSKDIMAALKQDFQDQQWSKLSDNAHNLKNAAGSLGLEALHSLAHQLETQAKHMQVDSVGLIMDDLDSVVGSSEHRLMAWQRNTLLS